MNQTSESTLLRAAAKTLYNHGGKDEYEQADACIRAAHRAEREAAAEARASRK